MNINCKNSFSLGAHVGKPVPSRPGKLEKAIGPVATVLLVVGVATIWSGMIIAPTILFTICLLLCFLKIYFLRKHRQSSFVWAFNLVITVFFLAIAFIDWKLKI